MELSGRIFCRSLGFFFVSAIEKSCHLEFSECISISVAAKSGRPAEIRCCRLSYFVVLKVWLILKIPPFFSFLFFFFFPFFISAGD